MASDPFGVNMYADVTRLLLGALGLLLVMVSARVAWLRALAPRGAPLRERSPWALMSYALFASLPVVVGLQELGEPLKPLVTVVTALALVFGFVAMFGEVNLLLWTGRSQPRAGFTHEDRLDYGTDDDEASPEGRGSDPGRGDPG